MTTITMNGELFQETPLVISNKLSRLNERNIYLKLDNCQPSGSFKLRGIGYMILKNYQENKIQNIVSSSGGNAGLAAAYSGYQLKIKTTIVTPSTTGNNVIEQLKNYGADVIVHGDVWDESDKIAQELCKTLEKGLYVPPFDHPLVWTGNATIIDEIKNKLVETRPDCIIVSVGGGGLACGIIEGMIKWGWMNEGVKLIAVETIGADCFHESVKANQHITLDKITSIAKTLGAKKCAPRLFSYWTQYSDSIESLVVSDKEALEACCRYLDDHKVLVEPSCGASLAVAYNMDKYLGKNRFKNVVVEVCGGSGLNLESLIELKKTFGIN